MRKVTIIGLVALGALALALRASTKPSRTVIPAALAQARYVALGYDQGARFFSDSEISIEQGRVLPEDREALNRLRSELQNWPKYVITIKPQEADLLMAVRTGRTGAVSFGAQIGSHDAGAVGSGTTVGSELSSPDDMLEVFESNSGRPGTLLWRGLLKHGLSGTPSPLFVKFKSDVESIAKH